MPRPNQYQLDQYGNPSSDATRLRPPEGLPDDVREVFLLIVSAAAPDHFAKAEAPLLIEYCHCIARAARAEVALRAEGEIVQGKDGPKANPWVGIVKDTRHSIANLATKLRLAPNARTESKQIKGGGRAGPEDVLASLRELRQSREGQA